MKEESKEKVVLNNTPQKDLAFSKEDGSIDEMTEEDLMYIKKVQEQIMSLQSSEGMDDGEIHAKLLQMLKSQDSMSEEERISRVLRLMNPRDAGVVAQNLKTMAPEERADFI